MDATYERIIDMINKKPRAHRELARKVLMWVAFARRSLTINELATAAAMDQGYGALLREHAIVHVDPNELLSRRPTSETILTACANLVLIDTENIVRFIHFSVQEFLLGGRSPVVASLKLEQETAHTEIALDCISFLILFPTPISVSPWAPNRGQTVLYPGDLANYACLSWPFHARALPSTRLSHELMAIITKFLEFGPIIREKPIEAGERAYHYQSNHDVRFSPATFALVLDLPLVYQHYCNLGFKWGEEAQKWPDDKLAMHYAVHENDLSIAKRLYDAGYPVDHFHLAQPTSIYAKMLTPLFGVEYSEEMATFLLDRGASVNPQPPAESSEELQEIEQHISKYSDLSRYPLQAEARRGNLKLMELLVERGAAVNAQGGRYGNALQAAAVGGHLEAVQFLLENGAKVNAEGGEFGFALQAACVPWPSGGDSENDHDHRAKVAQHLLDHGADLNALGGRHGTAFIAASRFGNIAQVRLLLEYGADEKAQGGFYGNALTAAASGRHLEVIKLLLERGADVNAQGGKFGFALQGATQGALGDPNIVQLLLDSGAAVNALGGENGTALAAAARHGSLQIVQLLLDRGADVNTQEGIYGSALQAAAAARPPKPKIIQLLLDRGAEVNIQCGQYGTALQAAALSGSYEPVKLLLDSGAVADIQGGYYGNALQAAAHGRFDFQGQRNRGRILEVIQLLLDRGVDVNAQGGYYGNALQAAVVSPRSGTLNYQVAELLLDKGAQVNALGGHYGYVLQAAAHGEYSPGRRYETVKVLEILQLLLDKGADVNAQGGKFGNAMRAALASTVYANLKLKDAIISVLRRNGCRAEGNPGDSTFEQIGT